MSETELDQELPEQQAPAVEVTPEPEVQEPKAPDPKDLAATLRHNLAKANEKAEAQEKTRQEGKPDKGRDDKGRDDKGRFLKPDEQKDSKQAKPPVDKTEAVKPDAVQQKDAAPGTWRDAAKKEWANTPPAVRAEALRRESELTQAVSKRDQQIQQINQAYGGLEKIIGPRRQVWAADYGSVEQGLNSLVSWSELASADPTAFLSRYLAVPAIAQKVDLQKIFGEAAPQGQPQAHPQLQAAMQEIAGLKQQLSGFLTQHQETQTSSVESQINDFVGATDEGGNLKRPHFEAVREDVFNLIPAIKAAMPRATVEQVMQRAYEVATRTNSGVAAAVQQAEEQRIRESIEKAERAKRAQIANKSGRPNAPAGESLAGETDPKDLRGTLKRNFRRAMNGEDTRI